MPIVIKRALLYLAAVVILLTTASTVTAKLLHQPFDSTWPRLASFVMGMVILIYVILRNKRT